jgi:hypothetical protein
LPLSLSIERPQCDVASQVLVVTGMHRSGTSLVSSLLQAAGVHVGDNLIAANGANPRGFFEDVDFFEFHEHMLHARGESYLYVDKVGDDFEPSPEELKQAVQMISARMQHCMWGWKDPRTSLFLKFWRKLLPQARFLLVYRHPLDVLLSLLRRGEFDEHPNLSAGLRAWHAYNRRIADFYEQYADDCLLVHINAVVTKIEQFSDLLQSKLQVNLPLQSENFDRIFHADELCSRPLPNDVNTVLSRLFPDVLSLYHRLNACADLPPELDEDDKVSTQSHDRLSLLAERFLSWPPPE